MERGVLADTGQNDTLYRTEDGGKTWAVSSVQDVAEPGVRQFAFVSPDEGWKVYCPQNKSIRISHMTDGVLSDSPVEVASDAFAYAFTFIDDQTGMILAEEPPFRTDSRMKLLVTNDAGQTWEPHSLPEGVNGNILILLQDQLPMQFSDELHGWILSAYGLLATGDGGKTWTWE